MPSSGLRGSYPLTNDGIDQKVTKVSAGAYALGHSKDATFHIKRIGRSDSDVADRLRDYIGDYARFKFEYYGSPKAAFEKECNLYHDFDPADNAYHPDRPNGTNWSCPRCAVFD